MYRQGDILLIRDDRPMAGERRRPVESGILALGETTGHAHRIVGGGVSEDGWGQMRVSAGPETNLVHEEHGTIRIPEGTYRVVRQRQFGDGGPRGVAD